MFLWEKSLIFNQSDFSPFLGAFEKLQKATISFVMSVRPHGTTRPPRNTFSCNFVFEYFSKICPEISSFIKNLPIITALYMKTNKHFWSYLTHLFLEWETFHTDFVEDIKTHILCSITLFRKSCRLWDNVEKYYTTGQATDDNIRPRRFACYITKAINTHSEFVILIAFPRQQ